MYHSASSTNFVDAVHADREAAAQHSARIAMLKRERGPSGMPLDRAGARRMTARRLAAAGLAAILSVAVAAAVVAGRDPITQDTIHNSLGGGKVLIR